MKPKYHRLFQSALIGVIAISSPSSFAASGAWTNVASGNWSAGPWTGGVPNGVGESATFSQDWTGQTITVDGTYTVGSILATDATDGAAAGLTLSGGVLILANGANKPIISSNANFTEGRWLTITSVLQGTNGFERTGIGYIRLYGTNTFSGTVKLTGSTGGSFVALNSDANLGNAGNTIEVATSGSATGFYNEASAGNFTLNAARTITTTGTGDFWVKNKTGANMTIAGAISGSANLRKNDSGTLTLTGANTYAGATKLDGGRLTLAGGSNRLPTTTTVQFITASTLDLTNTTQSVAALALLGGATNTITGAGGSLTVTNNANFTVSGADSSILDMAGLTNFTYNQATKNFSVQPVTSATTSTNTLNLAKAGTNNITAAGTTIGGGSGTSQGTAHEGRLGLGTANNFNTTALNVGGFNGSGLINFQSGLTTPTLTLRGLTGGSSRVTDVIVGATSSGTRSGAGVLNLTGGALDAQVTNLTVNRHIAGANTGITSSVTMPSGSLDATTIVLGDKTGTGTPTLTTNFNQGGGTVKVSTLTFGQDAGGGATPNFQSSYNLSGGTLSAETLKAGAGSFAPGSLRRIVWTGGTIANYNSATDLTINGVAGPGGAIVLALSTATAKSFDASAGRTISLGPNTSLTGSVGLTKSGDGTLLINGVSTTYTGTLTVGSGKLGGDMTTGGSIHLQAGSLAPGNSIGALVAASITWDSLGLMSFELSNVDNASDKLTLAGAFVKGTGDAFVFDFNGTGLGTLITPNTYTLVDFASSTFGVSDFSYINLRPGLAGTFGQNGGALTFTVIPEPGSTLASSLGILFLLRRRRSL